MVSNVMFFLVEMVTLELYIRNSEFKGIFWPILDQWLFMWMVLLDIKVSEENDGRVSG